MEAVQEQDLIRACEVIFGPGLDLSRGFLDYLQLSGLKTAYRKRARETHPDLNPEPMLQSLGSRFAFHEVQEAYEQLARFLSLRTVGPTHRVHPPRYWTVHPHPAERPRPAHTPRNTARAETRQRTETHASYRRNESPSSSSHTRTDRTSAGTASASRTYSGPLPRQKLLLGHFIYYSGRADWRTVVQALSWQMSQRPRIGELASKLGWLRSMDLHRLNRTRRGLEKFGESALRLGLLNEFQVRVLLSLQRRRQKRIGEFFVENRIFTPQEMDRIVEACRAHNASLESA